MNSFKSIAEIETLYESEWVLVGDPLTNDALEVESGIVLCHSTDRDTVYRDAIARRPKRFAILYTGSIPPGIEIVL